MGNRRRFEWKAESENSTSIADKKMYKADAKEVMRLALEYKASKNLAGLVGSVIKMSTSSNVVRQYRCSA